MSIKIHATCDALGNPTSFHLTPGHHHDLKGADVLLSKIKADYLLADCAYQAQKPNILIFDELTNHLDVEMRESLILAINDFKGAVILITHDWHLLRHTVDRLWLVADQTVKPYEGDLDDYRREVLGIAPKKDQSDNKKKKKK